jgi:hypothetical protein
MKNKNKIMLKEALSEGSKISSKRCSLAIFVLILIVVVLSEQWFGLDLDNEKFKSLVTLVEINLFAVLGDKVTKAFKKEKPEEKSV